MNLLEPSTHTNALYALPHQEALRRMSEGAFWESFFDYFLHTVHPAEFALVEKDGKACQREVALSAAFHRVFQTYNMVLGLPGWTSALEAPVRKDDGSQESSTEKKKCGLAYCDITLFPWDRNASKASKEAVRDPHQHIRVEVKWRDKANRGKADVTAMYKAANENESRQHFALILIFHGEGNRLAVHLDNGWDSTNQWEKVFVQCKKRGHAEFVSEYFNFTLVVLKNRKQCQISRDSVAVIVSPEDLG